jgi:hypothetical protein
MGLVIGMQIIAIAGGIFWGIELSACVQTDITLDRYLSCVHDSFHLHTGVPYGYRTLD